MTCPHCGAPMTDEQVFCEGCGKERQLVPVFEAEIDERLETAISGIASDLADTQEIAPLPPEALASTQEIPPLHLEEATEQTEEFEEENETDTDTVYKKNSSMFLVFMIGGVATVVALVLLTVVLFQMRNESSYDYHIKKAEEMSRLSDYEQMLMHAQEAIDLAPNSSDARMLIARAYEGMGNVQYEQEMLEDLLALDSAYAPAYELLIPLYEKEKDYDRIAELLLACKEQSVLDKYVDYLASPPQTSEEAGTYEQSVALKLIAAGAGKIYYTLDGSDPTENGREYMTPILLNSGHYTVKAVYENTYGIKSSVMQSEYYIDEISMGAPVILLESGTYSEPQYITVDIPDEEYQVYYTTDGSEPGMESTLYEGAIPLPLGDSIFAFVMYDEGGIPGEIAYARYRLEMELAFTGEQARNMLTQALITAGYITDADGHMAEVEGKRQYHATAIIAENDQYYYLLDEVFVAPDGISQKTGNQFAVSTTTGESFRAERNLIGTYELKRIQ